MAYSLKIGSIKTGKNWLVTWGVPIVLVLINNWQQIVPEQYTAIWAPIVGLVSYFIKNYVGNR